MFLVAYLQWCLRRASQKWFRQYWQRGAALSGSHTTPRASSPTSTSDALPLLLPLPRTDPLPLLVFCTGEIGG